ncbi:hypothetical protein BDV96DRAFT_644269 [Lophiotrema nucula]|uniref:BTB domain-containing protein n=1 Tax=Lophiotrema nucula TaxID=690887 RepID=A0A6A5ZEN4_9PLEO|nr:hypothetical protein BDV96DRAFT_644269 [Lophiotrema nucula]
MADNAHWIDPDADTVIILKNPVVRFAPWDEAEDVADVTFNEVEEKAQESDRGMSSMSAKKKGKKAVASDFSLEVPDPPAEPESWSKEEPVDDEWGFFSGASKKKNKKKKKAIPYEEISPSSPPQPPPELMPEPVPELMPEPVPEPEHELEISQLNDDWGLGSSINYGKKKKSKKGSKLNASTPTPPQPEIEMEPAAEPEAVTDEGTVGAEVSSIFGHSISKGESSTARLSLVETNAREEEETGAAPTIPITQENDLIEPDDSGIRFYVSSRHLKLASPWFKRAMRDYVEGSRDQVDGLYHVSAEGWDEEAFLLLMNIFHLQHRKVPKTLELEMLAKVAVLVDYYECGEAIAFFTDIWAKDMKDTIAVPTTYCRDLILWVWVAWVFEIADKFEEATAVVLTRGDEQEMRTCDLPIQSVIRTELENRRYQAIEAIMSGLDEWLDIYRSETYSCSDDKRRSSECGSILLGSLDRQIRAKGLSSPRPEVPFDGLSFEDVCCKVCSLKSPEWYDSSNRNHGYYNPIAHPCGFKTSVHSMADNVAATTKGLSIDSFSRSPAKK